jgi:hypothetical protein
VVAFSSEATEEAEMKNMEVDPRLKCKYRRGQRIRLRSHMHVLGGGYCGTFGVITEIRRPFSPRPFILARLETNEIVGLHPEDFTVVKE